MNYPPFHLHNYMPYRHELTYLRGTSLIGYRIRKENKLWARLRRQLTLWSVMAVTGLSVSVQSYA
jgi:hypothetical protein